MSRILPRTLLTAWWQFRPNFFLHCNQTQRNPFSRGLWTQIRIPLIAPAQHEKLAPETCRKPSAIDCWLSCSSGYAIFEVWMTVDSINNIPTTFDGIRMTDAVSSHYVVYRSSCKPTQGASKSDIGQHISIQNIVPWVFFLSRCGNYILTEHWGKILESPILHSIRPAKVDNPIWS
jgi:hypothetical protein